MALGRNLDREWSRACSESAEVDPSLPPVQGDGAPGTCEALGEVQVVSQLGWPIACEDSAELQPELCTSHLLMESPPPGTNEWVNCCGESCTFDLLATEQRCCDSSASSAAVCVGYLTVMLG